MEYRYNVVVSTTGGTAGDSWVHTRHGWKRLRDMGSSLRLHLRATSSSPPSSGSRKPSPSESPTRQREQHLRMLHHLLSQRCISARAYSSRENSQYVTISDAVYKLNFIQALNDTSCYPFVCQVTLILFEHKFWSLSGSMRHTLLRIPELAVEIAIERLQYTGLVKKLVERAITTLEIGRKQRFTGLTVHTTDVKIKALLKSKRQLLDAIIHDGPSANQSQQSRGMIVSDLPADCLRHILSFLKDPLDINNLGQTCSKLYSLANEGLLWNQLVSYHYGKVSIPVEYSDAAAAINIQVPWKSIFITHYRGYNRKLKLEKSGTVCLCQSCHFVFWKAYGHPCLEVNCHPEGRSKNTEIASAQIRNQPLTVDEFLGLFVL